MATPSLLIVPDRFKAGKLYTQIPTSGAGDFTVTRGTTATRINSAGLIESVASGVPRLDYGAGACPGLLVEPAATNLWTNSADFTSLSSTNNVTITQNGSNRPTLEVNPSTRIECTSTGVNANIRRNFTLSTSVVYTFSLFARKKDTDFIILRVDSLSRYINFNINSGVITNISGSGVSGNITSVGGGWFRCSITWTPSSTSETIRLYPSTISNDLNGVLGENDFFGAQVEEGSVATSYIPTTSAAVTRNADVISLTNASGFINATEYTMYAEFVPRNYTRSDLTSILNLNQSALSNANRHSISINTSNELSIGTRRSNVTQAFVSSAVVFNSINKVAVAISSAGQSVYLNGVLLNEDATILIPQNLSVIDIGNASGLGPRWFFNDRINAVALYPTRLDNATLAQLTSL